MTYVTLYWYLSEDGEEAHSEVGGFGEVVSARNKLEREFTADGWKIVFENNKRAMLAMKNGRTRTFRIGRVRVPHTSLL